MSQVKSEIQNEKEGVVEQMPEDVSREVESVSRFQKDQDLSLAKSEFIQSSNLDGLKIESKLKDKSKEIANQNKEKAKPNTAGGNRQIKTKTEVKTKKPVAKPQQKQQQIKEDKKPKLS